MNLIIRWFVKLTGVLPALIFFKPRVKREAKLPKGGVMIVSNHKSLMDFVLWLLVFWYKSLHTLVAEVLYSKTPVLSWLLNRLGCIKVDRDAKKVDFIEKSTRLLKKGRTILVFPEGQLRAARAWASSARPRRISRWNPARRFCPYTRTADTACLSALTA